MKIEWGWNEPDLVKKQKAPQPVDTGKLTGESTRLSEGMTLADCSELPAINELRAALSLDQLEILEDIWSRYREAKSWPKRADVTRSKGTTQATLDLLDTIGGSFVFETESHGSSPSELELTLLGSLLLHRQQDLLKLLSAYLDLLRQTFIESGLRTSITWREVQSSLEISDQELNELFAAVCAFNFFWSALEGDSVEGGIKLAADIDRLQDFSGGAAFLIERARGDYHPGKFTTTDRRTTCGQLEHYIEESDLSYFHGLDRLAEQLVYQILQRATATSRIKAILILMPFILALLAAALFLGNKGGVVGLGVGLVSWSGVGYVGIWKWLFPKLTECYHQLELRRFSAAANMMLLQQQSPLKKPKHNAF